MSDISEISKLKSEPASRCARLETWYTRHTLYYRSLSQDNVCRILRFICEQINKYKLTLTVSMQREKKKMCTHTVTPTRTSLVVSVCPIPVVLRCYLSLTCHGCHILMDGKQIGRRERREHQDINKASLCISPLLRLSHNTQLLTAGFLVVEQMVILGTLTC